MYAGVAVGMVGILFMLLHIIFDWETAPLVPQILFSIVMGVPVLLYTFAPKILRPIFSDDSTWDTERPATMSRMRRFGVGWFSVSIPGLLILEILVRPALQ